MKRTIWQDLLKRRVPHVVGIYLGISWGLLEFVGFLVNQYGLSPHLVTFSLVTLVSLIPSVSIMAYFHGAPGRQGWTKVEKVTVPFNLLASFVLLALIFSGKDLGAATTTVTVTDEDGVAVDRVIPKSEFRKRITVFFFDAPRGDSAAAWLQYGLPHAIAEDLSQDHWIDFRYVPLFAERVREAGFPSLTGVPLALQREIADEQHRDQFLAGEVTVEDGEIQATVTLYDARRGRALNEHTVTGPDVMELADQITVQLKADLEVPELGGEAGQDLPVAETMTESPEAYRAFVEGVRAMWVDQDFEAAVPHFTQATALDPTFATAQFALGQVLYLSNRGEEAVAPFQAAMDHLYRIPERARFGIKSDYYFIVRQDMDKALASVVMWADLFPDDLGAYAARVQIQTLRNDRPGIIASLEKILELDPAQKDVLLEIGTIHQAMGNLVSAQEAFRSYADEFPEDHEVLTRLAGVSRLRGDLDEALGHYDRAQLLAPSDVGVTVGMGNVLRTMGDFDRAMEQYDAAMSMAGTPEERAEVHGALESFYRNRGQMGKMIEHLEQRMAETALSQPGLFATLIRLRQMPGPYIDAGREADALAVVERARTELPPPFDAFLPIGNLGIQLAKEDADGVEATLPAMEAMIDAFQNENVRPWFVHAEGRIHELRGEYRAAIERYEEEQRLNPADINVPAHLGRCYRGLEEYDRAVALFQESLNSAPWAPRVNYELALTYVAMGRAEDARRHLERALEVWVEADEGYEPAVKAQEALGGLGG